MEPSKLRGISIIAAEAAASEKPRGISIHAVRAVVADALLLTRSLSGTFSSAGSVPIRASVTTDDEDDDDDSGSVTAEHNLDASSYSKGIDSGADDGFESVSGDADDETELEGLIRDELRVHGVLGEESVGENGDGSDFSGGSVVFRPVAGGVEEERSVNYSPFEEVSEESVGEGEVSEADGVGMKDEVFIPRAILSLDNDGVLGSSGDEETALLRGDEEAEVEDRMLQFGDMRMVDEPECSDSVLTDVVSAEGEDGLISIGNIEDLSLSIPPGSSNDLLVENAASLGLDGSSTQLIEEGFVHRTTIKEDGSGSIDALMKPEGVEDSAVESEERGMTIFLEGSGSVTGERVSTEEDDMVQVNLSYDASVTGLGVAPGDCREFVLESEGNVVDADKGLDETFSKLVERGVSQESISKESNNKIDDGSCEEDESMIQGEETIGLGSRESEDEDTENACSAVRILENPECEDEPEIGMSYESSQVTPTVDSVTTIDFEVAPRIDVAISGCGSSNLKADQEPKNEGKQESKDTYKKLSLPDEDMSSISFEMANESVENEEQISEQIDSEPNQISAGMEETGLLSVKDVERTMRDSSCVTANNVVENETQIPPLIHNHTCMEPNEYEGTDDTKEKLSESAFQNYFEELSSDNSVQLISGRVKERVEKTKLLKEKLQRIVRGIDLRNEDSAVTEVESQQQSLVSGEHHTSLELDHMYDGPKTKLEFPVGLDFSINILVIGKTGVGKSATINSIFGETKCAVNAFEVTTKSADYVVGNVGGILIRILDTPGLMSSASEEWYNQDVLMSIKKRMRRFPVDVILYIDRLDENPDIHLLRTITNSLGSSIWKNAIVVLTHAASDVSDSSRYQDFIAQRSSLTHQSIRQAVLMLSCESKIHGIVLAENNMSSLCGNTTSESTCQDWRLKLLILCCLVKNRCKAGSLLKQNTPVEKPDAFSSLQLGSFTLFCSLWNVLLVDSNQGQASHSLDDLEEKKRRLLDSYPEILWDEQSQECLKQEMMKNQEAEDEERRHEEAKRNMSVRTRRRGGRLGFQATRRFGIYLDTCDLHTGFSLGSSGSRKVEQEEGKLLVRMRRSLSVLGVVHVLTSVITCVYGGKYN